MSREGRRNGKVGRVHTRNTRTASTGLGETRNHGRRQSHITQVDSLSQKPGLFSHVTSKNRLNLSIGRGTRSKPTSGRGGACSCYRYAGEVDEGCEGSWKAGER